MTRAKNRGQLRGGERNVKRPLERPKSRENGTRTKGLGIKYKWFAWSRVTTPYIKIQKKKGRGVGKDSEREVRKTKRAMAPQEKKRGAHREAAINKKSKKPKRQKKQGGFLPHSKIKITNHKKKKYKGF